jgi:ferric-dicitrate binding protein FerR (iron transport regulator)
MLVVNRRWIVTTQQEQRVWDDLARLSAVEAEQPVPTGRRPERRRPRSSAGLEEIAIGGAFIGVMLVLVGGWPVGLAVGVAAALGWLLVRFRPRCGMPKPRRKEPM